MKQRGNGPNQILNLQNLNTESIESKSALTHIKSICVREPDLSQRYGRRPNTEVDDTTRLNVQCIRQDSGIKKIKRHFHWHHGNGIRFSFSVVS